MCEQICSSQMTKNLPYRQGEALDSLPLVSCCVSDRKTGSEFLQAIPCMTRIGHCNADVLVRN